jgi:hypothetical protein
MLVLEDEAQVVSLLASEGLASNPEIKVSNTVTGRGKWTNP